MSINFPLILFLLVFFSGIIWLFDSMFFLRKRNHILQEIRAKFPKEKDWSKKQVSSYEAEVKKLAREPIIVEYSRAFFPVLLFVFIVRSFIVEPFQIPSSSMVPTLQVGDYILVNKYTYGIRLPVIRTKVFDVTEPQRGDVMVFFPPHMKDTYYIKRIIGLPGDIISYRNKQLSVNGSLIETDWQATVNSNISRYIKGSEKLGSDAHLMQIDTFRPDKSFSVVVKPGHYFMMGDNRDNSSDSRVWGQVSEQQIVGRAFAIWMHWDSFFSLPAFNRVGLIK